jgi:hypothetical protein
MTIIGSYMRNGFLVLMEDPPSSDGKVLAVDMRKLDRKLWNGPPPFPMKYEDTGPVFWEKNNGRA